MRDSELENSFGSNGNAANDDLRENQVDDRNREKKRQFAIESDNHQLEAVIENDYQCDAAVNGNVQNVENNDADIETESLEDNCVADMAKGFSKDIGFLYSKISGLESDVKEIKRLLKNRSSQKCNFRSLSSQLQEQ